MTIIKKRFINVTLEGESLAYFEAAYKESGLTNASDFIRSIIRKEYLENVKS